jgi:hypothetical protein
MVSKVSLQAAPSKARGGRLCWEAAQVPLAGGLRQEPRCTTCRNPAKLMTALMPSVGEHSNSDRCGCISARNTRESAALVHCHGIQRHGRQSVDRHLGDCRRSNHSYHAGDHGERTHGRARH